MQVKRKLYCGGKFAFDYQKQDYETQVKNDYRANILGNFHLLLDNNKCVEITENVNYIGPFYFETDGMIDKDIVSTEKQMIEQCTDAIFLLDDGLCPGTISELIYASTLSKTIHIFYIKRKDTEETESTLHSPCWYPIILSEQLNNKTIIYSCDSFDDANQKMKKIINSF